MAVTVLGLTPSVSNARDRVAALAATHPLAEPGVWPRDAVAPPTKFVAALVAVEDTRFFVHHGIDTVGLARAAMSALSGGAGDPGGSTLDQQLAKQLYFQGRQGGAWLTVGELVTGVKLDLGYSKWQILRMYAAVVYFGNGFYGLSAAAAGYFGLRPAQLSWAQAAMLAGLVQAPSADDPLTHPELARQRQAHVLDRLVDAGDLTTSQAATAASAPVYLRTPTR